LKVELSEEARAQAKQIDAWWRENRDGAPDLFTDELDQALAMLERKPSLGSPYEAGTKRARRLLLRRTHYHVYVVDQGERLFVVAIWSAFRGRSPIL
jgi:plasmid stabilization system protein ParE